MFSSHFWFIYFDLRNWQFSFWNWPKTHPNVTKSFVSIRIITTIYLNDSNSYRNELHKICILENIVPLLTVFGKTFEVSHIKIVLKTVWIIKKECSDWLKCDYLIWWNEQPWTYGDFSNASRFFEWRK